jgi:hypothetical protein
MRAGMVVAGVLLAGAATLGGCYSPSPPSGAYLCSTGDAVCPTGQHCTCGLCVQKDSDAACGFQLRFEGDAPSVTKQEHESFPLTISALGKDGMTPSTGFNGTVKLFSTWGDVRPNTATLVNGQVTATVELNRETLTPAVAKVSAVFEGNQGVSRSINVVASPFTVDADPIDPPFGWATTAVAEPNVVRAGSLYTMYYMGLSLTKLGFGVATSTDGKTFAAKPDPVFPLSEFALSPTTFSNAAGVNLAYANKDGIVLATSPDGLQPFTVANGGAAILRTDQCAYCGRSVTFPQIFPDTTATLAAVAKAPFLMFFSAVKADNGAVSIGRASSPDGVTWTPEPAPVLSGELNGEAVLLSPRVLIDGTVFKMWYSFARLEQKPCLGTGQSTCATGQICQNNSCVQGPVGDDTFSAFCEAGVQVNVGYATSSDGFFWTRSLSNPVIQVDSPGVQAGSHAILVSSVVPGDDLKSVTLHFSTFKRLLALKNGCFPNTIARATRP